MAWSIERDDRGYWVSDGYKMRVGPFQRKAEARSYMATAEPVKKPKPKATKTEE